MVKDRLVYQDWIVALGHDPCLHWQEAAGAGTSYNAAAIRAVTEALGMLSEDEAAFIRLFYFQGMRYEDMGRLSGRAKHKLARLHQKAIRKLRLCLQEILDPPPPRAPSAPSQITCLVCNHPRRDEINLLIKSKSNRETWKRIIRTLRQEYDLMIPNPHRLIGHRKYHMI